MMARKTVAALAALGVAALGVVALAACAGPAAAPPSVACRSGPDGRRPEVAPASTDRGLGATGSVADRGIGGTGPMADGGLGGTGIVGTITGFASVCVNGVEVEFGPAAPVQVDGVRRTADALRTGQVTVSGLRDPDGTIHASRIEPAAPGVVTISGPLARHGGAGRIGAMRLRGGGALPESGRPVTVAGRLQGDVRAVESLTVDPVLPDRAELRRFLVETYARRDGDTLVLGPGLRAALGAGVDPPAPDRPAVLVLELNAQGDLVATGQGPGGGDGGSSGATGSGQGAATGQGGPGFAGNEGGGHGSAGSASGGASGGAGAGGGAGTGGSAAGGGGAGGGGAGGGGGAH